MQPEQAQASDVDLLHAVARGDELALGSLYDRYRVILFGVLMVITAPDLLKMHWLQAKLGLVALVSVYQAWCKKLLVAFREGKNTRSAITTS